MGELVFWVGFVLGALSMLALVGSLGSLVGARRMPPNWRQENWRDHERHDT